MIVPFLDLARTHASLSESILRDLADLIDTGMFVDGPAVGVFESAFAMYTGTAHAVGTASGLDALRLALISCGLQPGEEVIVPAATFVATLEAVTQAGGVPRIVDIEDSDLNLSPSGARAALTKRTRVVLPVHLYGQLSNMRDFVDMSQRHDLVLIEDAAQAHGAVRDGARAGTVGRASAFSFYPGKNLGAMGDAGALTTDEGRLAETVGALRQHGQRAKYIHELEGYTARLDTIQALVLLRKLPMLDGWNEERRHAAALYLDALGGVGDLRLPPIASGSNPVWHLFVIRTADPDGLGGFLRGRGIETGRHYPVPVHLCPAYEHLGYKRGSFPVAESLARTCLSLPIFPGIVEAELEIVVEAIAAYFDG